MVPALAQEASSATCHTSFQSIQRQSNGALLIWSQHGSAGKDAELTSCLLPLRDTIVIVVSVYGSGLENTI